MKCLYCSKPIDGSVEAFVTIPNPEQCGYRSRRPTKFVHANCFEREVRENSVVPTQLREAAFALILATESMLQAYEALMPGLRHIAVTDYMLINDAPIQARSAIANMTKRLGTRTQNISTLEGR